MMKAIWRSSFFAITSLVFTLGSVCSWAKVIYVDHSDGGTPDGSSWDDAYLTIQAGLNAAGNGDEVWVAQGTYGETIYINGGSITTTSIWMSTISTAVSVVTFIGSIRIGE